MYSLGPCMARQRTWSQCACDINPRATMSRGAIGSSWSAAFVVGVTTFFSNLQAEHYECVFLAGVWITRVEAREGGLLCVSC